MPKEEYLTMYSLQNDRSVVIKLADKGSAVVVRDRNELVEKSNDLFSNLRRKNVITENENNLL